MLNNLFKCAGSIIKGHVIRSKNIRSKKIRSDDHQKHISLEATSPELTKDSVRSVRPRTLQPPSLQCLSLQQDKDYSNIAAEVVPFVLEWIWIKFFFETTIKLGKGSRMKNQCFKARHVDVTAKFSTSLNSSINRDEDLENKYIDISRHTSKGQYSAQNVENKHQQLKRILPIVLS